MWDAKGWISAGMTCLAYQWGYVPLCGLVGIVPWSLSWYGGLLLATGTILAVSQAMMES